MKIIFEFDDKLIEETKLESTLFYNDKLKQLVSREVKSQLADKYVEKADFGDLGITKEELKAAVIDKMAENALNKDRE